MTEQRGLEAELPVGSLVDLIPTGLLVADTGGRILYANRALASMFGHAPAELIGRQVEALLPLDLRAAKSLDFARHELNPLASAPQTALLSCEAPGGGRLACEVSLSPLGTTGTGLMLVAVRDATSRVETETALRESEQRWRDLLEGVHLAAVGLGLDGRVTFANAHFLQLTGYEHGEVVGRDWFSDFLSAPTRGEIEAIFDQVLAHGGEEHHVNSITTKSGAQRLISWFNTPQHDRHGAVVGTLSLGEDITDQARDEARLEAIYDVSHAVLADEPTEDVLRLLARRARELVGADLAAVIAASDAATITITAASGANAERFEGKSFPREGTVTGRVLTSGAGELLDDVAEDVRLERPIPEPEGIGPALCLPMVAHQRVVGALTISNLRGGQRFSAEDLEILSPLVEQASLAVEYARAQRTISRLAVVEDRERIARDLHDHVIQRLFAAGLGLQAVLTVLPQETPASERIFDTITELDRTIADLRLSIFDLQRTESRKGLRARVLEVVDEALENLGFRPQVEFVGPIDSAVPDDLAGHVIAVVREALSNTARHARARSVSVRLESGDELMLRVVDDGIGIPPVLQRESGLSNLRARAVHLGGSLAIDSGRGAGTTLEWRVPIAP